MGKRKYTNVRKANKNVKHAGHQVPNYVSYNLAELIRTVDIGIVHNVNTLISSPYQNYDGAYREPIPYIQRLASFYLKQNEDRVDKLKEFSDFQKKCPDSFVFFLAVGGDGAPGAGTSILVSFLNCGQRLASSSENFLIFGANVNESSEIVTAFLTKLHKDLQFLINNVFNINGRKVEFRVGELPNDMKMLCYLSGELTNTATYFSSFANVSQSSSNDFKKTFMVNGSANSNENWSPWNYAKRISDAEKVAKKKSELNKTNNAESTKRQKLTAYISKDLQSRQEFKPILGQFVSCAKAEPLHLKNNTVKEHFMKLFKICTAETNFRNFKNFKDLPSAALIVKFVIFIHNEMNCNFLSKKITTWFNESFTTGNKEFGFRFRGKVSFHFLKNFPKLILFIFNEVKNVKLKQRLMEIHLQCINLRKILSLCVRIVSFDETMLQEMFTVGKQLFKLCCLFDQTISPSLWTVCNAAPVHAGICYKEYSFGLGCNSMEGREQKHQAICRYANNTTFQNRWPAIFRHEYIHLIYLRENGFDKLNYKKKNTLHTFQQLLTRPIIALSVVCLWKTVYVSYVLILSWKKFLKLFPKTIRLHLLKKFMFTSFKNCVDNCVFHYSICIYVIFLHFIFVYVLCFFRTFKCIMLFIMLLKVFIFW